MAVKIKLKRVGKVHQPQYRIVVADSRTKRDGRAIEEIGRYDPMQEPSLIQLDSDRAQYWLSVGAQPTQAVQALLTVTGDWQRFRGLPGAEGTLRVAPVKPTRAAVFEAAAREAMGERPTVRLAPEVQAAEQADAAAAATQQQAETAGVAALADAEAVVEQAAETAEKSEG